MATKNWQESKTIILNGLMALISLAVMAAKFFSDPAVAAALPSAWVPFITAFIGLVNVYLRYAHTGQPIAGSPMDPGVAAGSRLTPPPTAPGAPTGTGGSS